MAAVRFKVGDKVKINKHMYGHHFKRGEIVTITKICADCQPPCYKADSDNDYWYVCDEELCKKTYN